MLEKGARSREKALSISARDCVVAVLTNCDTEKIPEHLTMVRGAMVMYRSARRFKSPRVIICYDFLNSPTSFEGRFLFTGSFL